MRVVPVLRSIELPLEFFDLFFPSYQNTRAHVCVQSVRKAAKPHTQTRKPEDAIADLLVAPVAPTSNVRTVSPSVGVSEKLPQG